MSDKTCASQLQLGKSRFSDTILGKATRTSYYGTDYGTEYALNPELSSARNLADRRGKGPSS